jgi:hypothetical protein
MEGRMACLLVAVLGLGPGCQLLLDFSPLGDAGPSDASGQFCSADNNDLASAAAITFGAVTDGGVCGEGDVDFHKFTVDGNQDITALLEFTASQANDLDMQLWSIATATVVTLSTRTDGQECFTQSLERGNRLAAGDYAVEVYGRANDAFNDYQLTVSILGAGGTPDAGL